ncbi:MAG: ArsR/SmtB family transcription factor, partial [Gemmatimonadota bacterium]
SSSWWTRLPGWPGRVAARILLSEYIMVQQSDCLFLPWCCAGGDDMAKSMSPELLTLVAERFKALADPARLRLLNALRPGELTVGDLVESTELSQANVSKHLAQLHTLGFVRRRKEGLFVYYSLMDKDIFRLCDVMCGRIEAELKDREKLLRPAG